MIMDCLWVSHLSNWIFSLNRFSYSPSIVFLVNTRIQVRIFRLDSGLRRNDIKKPHIYWFFLMNGGQKVANIVYMCYNIKVNSSLKLLAIWQGFELQLQEKLIR